MTLPRFLAGPIWRWPMLLALLSLFGLVSALLADGLWDTPSWLALAVPVVLCIRFGLRRP